MSLKQREAARKAALEQDLKLLVPIAKRQARKAGKHGITTANVKNAAGHLLPAYSDRGYLSALWSGVMLRAELQPAGYQRTPRIGRKGGSIVRVWRCAA